MVSTHGDETEWERLLHSAGSIFEWKDPYQKDDESFAEEPNSQQLLIAGMLKEKFS